MSYTTLSRHLEPTNSYAYPKGGGPPGGTGMSGVWWPVYGPGTRDFSAQDKSHPAETIFDKVIAPGKWSATKVRVPPKELIQAAQLRHPAPAREAVLREKEHPDIDVKLRAHEFTERQAALRRAEMRQRRIDAWAGEAPIRMTASTLSQITRRSMSETSLSALDCSQASRTVYEKNGFLVGRTKEKPRGSRPLSYHSMVFAGDMMKSPKSTSRVGRKPRKYDMQWRTLPENKFVFDPKSFLPVPRGGWGSQLSDEWPDADPVGRREFAARPFEKPQPAALEDS
eukprot:TRINITY_DN45790_c0_g1_i1.p1 TRINITY_DN45790_c0_g1~~TRINITY_DN45790_c0_g1_i1.p1  ORF type:complete len:283 (+),score=39.01 TRINITY_DN45790_c0_g1_i1:72-920(+)